MSIMQVNILECLSHLQISGVTCGKVRTGGPNDGGYIIANDLELNEIAYSIGVGPQVQWDYEMAERGFLIYQYDHTVPGLPQQHRNFRYERLGIAPNLDDPLLITLDEMLLRNNHCERSHMLLKIDIEGAEWDVLDNIQHDTLAKFDQIIIEYHGLRHIAQESMRARCNRVFKKLNYFHVPIHVHANNYASVEFIEGVPVPDVIEVTYCLRSRFNFFLSEEIFPTSLDEPCNKDIADIYLGAFRFSRRNP